MFEMIPKENERINETLTFPPNNNLALFVSLKMKMKSSLKKNNLDQIGPNRTNFTQYWIKQIFLKTVPTSSVFLFIFPSTALL